MLEEREFETEVVYRILEKKVYDTMMPIVQATFLQRSSKAANMNGRSKVSGSQRADVRLAVDQACKMYVYGKSDDMCRSDPAK